MFINLVLLIVVTQYPSYQQHHQKQEHQQKDKHKLGAFASVIPDLRQFLPSLFHCVFPLSYLYYIFYFAPTRIFCYFINYFEEKQQQQRQRSSEFMLLIPYMTSYLIQFYQNYLFHHITHHYILSILFNCT